MFSFPIEVWERIFLFAIVVKTFPVNRPPPSDVVLDSRLLLRLTRVCKHWKDIIYDRSMLWSFIPDFGDLRIHSNQTHAIKLEDMLLDLSRDSVLHENISISMGSSRSLARNERVYRLFEESVNGRQFSTLIIQFYKLNEIIRAKLLAYLNRPAPALECLSLTASSEDSDRSRIGYDSIPNFHAPNLRRLVLDCVDDIPWNSGLLNASIITSLQLKGIQSQDGIIGTVFTILRRCPNLQHLVLQVIRGIDRLSPPSSIAPVHLPNLRWLDFSFNSRQGAQVVAKVVSSSDNLEQLRVAYLDEALQTFDDLEIGDKIPAGNIISLAIPLVSECRIVLQPDAWAHSLQRKFDVDYPRTFELAFKHLAPTHTILEYPESYLASYKLLASIHNRCNFTTTQDITFRIDVDDDVDANGQEYMKSTVTSSRNLRSLHWHYFLYNARQSTSTQPIFDMLGKDLDRLDSQALSHPEEFSFKWNYPIDGVHRKVVQNITGYLRRRMERKMKVGRLSFRGSGETLDDSTQLALQDLVGALETVDTSHI